MLSKFQKKKLGNTKPLIIKSVNMSITNSRVVFQDSIDTFYVLFMSHEGQFIPLIRVYMDKKMKKSLWFMAYIPPSPTPPKIYKRS